MRGAYTVGDIHAAPHNGATFVSTYSGCGGLDVGFRMAGFEPVWASDFDVSATSTYRDLLGDHVVTGLIEDVALPRRGAADIVIGGPPCQGFSVVGKMDPRDPRSQHVFRFLAVVERVRPQAFVMENVKALAMSARWAVVREALEARAKELGYRTTLLVLNAAQHGVAQRRERMFLVGFRGRAGSDFGVIGLGPLVPVGAALADLPRLGEPGNDTRCTAVIRPARRPVLRPTPYKGSLLFNGNGRPLDLETPAPTLPASMGGNATPIVDQAAIDTAAESWVVAYHRRLIRGGPPNCSP